MLKNADLVSHAGEVKYAAPISADTHALIQVIILFFSTSSTVLAKLLTVNSMKISQVRVNK